MKRLQKIWVRRLIWNHMSKTQAALVFSSFVHNSIRGRDCSSVRLSVHPFPVLSFSLSERAKRERESVWETEKENAWESSVSLKAYEMNYPVHSKGKWYSKTLCYLLLQILRQARRMKSNQSHFDAEELDNRMWVYTSAGLVCSQRHVMRVRKLDDTIGQFIAHQAAKSCSTRFADTFLMFWCIPMRGVVDLS